jgi:hypothetical protein
VSKFGARQALDIFEKRAHFSRRRAHASRYQLTM